MSIPANLLKVWTSLNACIGIVHPRLGVVWTIRIFADIDFNDDENINYKSRTYNIQINQW